VRFRAPFKTRLNGVIPGPPNQTPLRVSLFSPLRPRNSYNLSLQGSSSSLFQQLNLDDNVPVKLLEMMLSRDLKLPIYEESSSSRDDSLLDLAAVASEAEDSYLQTLAPQPEQERNGTDDLRDAVLRGFPDTTEEIPTGTEKALVASRSTALQRVVSAIGDEKIFLSKQFITVRYVKLITETSVKKTKKQGNNIVKKTKNNTILTFSSATVLQGTVF
jgi:hypothetical protein